MKKIAVVAGQRFESFARLRQRVGKIVLDLKSLFREIDRRCDQLGEREFAGSIFRMSQRKARDSAGNADGERTVARFFRIGISLRIEKHCLACRSWRGLAVINSEIAVIPGEMNHHEATAADVAGPWIGDCHRETDGDRGVDGIAAAIKKFNADAGGAFFLCDNQAVAGDDGLRGVDRRRARDRRHLRVDK